MILLILIILLYLDVLSYVKTVQEIEFYMPGSKMFQSYDSASLRRFINMLKDLADVFELPTKNIHIFYDNSSSLIAFNRNGALFFNLNVYITLHDEKCKNNPTIDAMAYWFMKLCHELAHNFTRSHNYEHEVSVILS